MKNGHSHARHAAGGAMPQNIEDTQSEDAMSEKTHEEDHSGPIKSPSQLFWAAAGGFVLPIFIIMALVTYFTSGSESSPGETDSAQKVAARIQKVGQVEIQASAPASGSSEPAAAQQTAAAAQPATPAAPAPAAPAADAAKAAPAAAGGSVDLAAGKALYDKSCVACHGTGVAGAPKLGDKAAWAPRIAEGMDAMMKIAINGKGAMPPRGATTASDAELRAAVEYMAQAAK